MLQTTFFRSRSPAAERPTPQPRFAQVLGATSHAGAENERQQARIAQTQRARGVPVGRVEWNFKTAVIAQLAVSGFGRARSPSAVADFNCNTVLAHPTHASTSARRR